MTEADFIVLLYDAIVANPEKVGHGRDGFYFGENGEHSWYDISKAIGQALVKLGVSESDEPTPFTTEELVKYFGSEVSYHHRLTVSRDNLHLATGNRQLLWN